MASTNETSREVRQPFLDKVCGTKLNDEARVEWEMHNVRAKQSCWVLAGSLLSTSAEVTFRT